MLARTPHVLLHDGACPQGLERRARDNGWDVCVLDDYEPPSATVVVLGSSPMALAIRARHPDAVCLSTAQEPRDADLWIPASAPDAAWDRLLALAANHLAARATARGVTREIAARDTRIRQLAEIGRRLARERDQDKLLETILTEGRRISGSEAGSLYLIDHENAAPCLVFKLAQNDAVPVVLNEARMPLTTDSLSGYVAVTGEVLNIADAYAIPDDRPFAFNPSFDERTGYRTRSLLTLPMRDHRGNVVGVLQFINRVVDGAVVPYDGEVAELMEAVASQAALALQKNRLIGDIRVLFESFVQAAVKAIEQRDPSTSGHSFRVADYTVRLLEALPRSGLARFKGLSVGEESLTEVRYAALLHDFGKVGVRESILVKPNKLTEARFEVMRYRFELRREQLRRRAVEQELELLHLARGDFDVERRRIHRTLARDLSRLNDLFDVLVDANSPRIVDEQVLADLKALREEPLLELDGREGNLVDDADLAALSVRRGSLTAEERREIQSHVTHTRDFLAVLPWPPELARVPLIAAAHHEKLDGSGYPLGLRGDEIPLASRVMTVCDIYDALTAMDRPYKSSLGPDAALSILREEVSAGMLDADVLGVFIASGVYRADAADRRRAVGPL
jgi:HD-GYP domain-containing protein (c-di-GMP phosphodiesterase class II)